MTSIPRRLRRTARDEGGAAALELVLIAPVLVLTFMLLVQWAVREQGERAVRAAAREGAAAASAWQAEPGAGEEAVHSTLASSGADLDHTEVAVGRTSTTATVTVAATVPSLLPGVDLSVSSTQTSPLEVFVP